MIGSRANPVSGVARVAAKAAVALCIAAAAGFAIPAGTAKTYTIAMDGTRFIPDTLTVQRGDRVVWVNKDPFPHTATARGTFDSKSVAAGHSWSYVARQTGEIPYVCTLHPGMKGALLVQ